MNSTGLFAPKPRLAPINIKKIASSAQSPSALSPVSSPLKRWFCKSDPITRPSINPSQFFRAPLKPVDPTAIDSVTLKSLKFKSFLPSATGGDGDAMGKQCEPESPLTVKALKEFAALGLSDSKRD
jgi:hypothetical protein